MTPDEFKAETAQNVKNLMFINDLLAVFKKHNLAVVPTVKGHVSFEHPFTITPNTPETEQFVAQAIDEKTLKELNLFWTPSKGEM